MLLHVLAVASAMAAVGAQSTRTATATTSSASAVTTHMVAVGATGFQYEPNVTRASVGDIVQFNFYPGGHSVARSEFGFPCMPYENYGINRQGFYSGIVSPAVYTSGGPNFQIRINDTAPIFYYCTAPGSCYVHHMIGVINPSANQTFEKQHDAVLLATTQIAPGEPVPSETLPASSSPPAATSTTAPVPTVTAAVVAASSNSNSTALGSGGIAGIAIGAAAVLVLAAALIYMCGRNSRRAASAQPESVMPPSGRYSFPPGAMVQDDRHSYVPGAMVDAKFGPPSPGQAGKFHNSAHYSLSPGNDTYRASSHNSYSPPLHQYPSGTGSPPISPGFAPYQAPGQQVNSPLMGGVDAPQPYQDLNQQLRTSPQPAAHHPEPVPEPAELPASADPGNSPIPPYSAGNRHMSWNQGEEATYRPGPK